MSDVEASLVEKEVAMTLCVSRKPTRVPNALSKDWCMTLAGITLTAFSTQSFFQCITTTWKPSTVESNQ